MNSIYWCCLFFLKPPSSRKCFHSEWLVFCVNNILLAKPSVSYFCPANLQSLIGTAVLANQIGHRSFRHFFFSSQYYFFVTNISCLELALQLWKLLQYPHRRRRFSPYTDVAEVYYLKHLVAIWFLCSLLCFMTGIKLKLPLSHAYTEPCLHNVSPTENAAAFVLVARRWRYCCVYSDLGLPSFAL